MTAKERESGGTCKTREKAFRCTSPSVPLTYRIIRSLLYPVAGISDRRHLRPRAHSV